MESFRRKDDLLHGWGSLHGTGEAPCTAWLAIGDAGRMPAILGKTDRSVDDRISIDFVLYGAMKNTHTVPDPPDLVLEWRDGRQQRLPLSSPRQAPAGRGLARLAGLPWKHYFTRGWRLIRQGQSLLLLRKMAGMAHAMLTSGWRPVRLLEWIAAEGKPLALVIDHDLGGGANLYRRSLLARLATEGFEPLLLSAHHGILACRLSAQRGRRNRSAHIEDLALLFEHLTRADIQRVVFNNVLSFPAPLKLVRQLSGWLQQNPPAQFTFLVHDYYSICPVWLLLDDTGKFCRIPDPLVCASCLRSNPSPFLEFSAGIDITGWREAWGGLLRQAAEIRCFSNSSRELLLRAHPALDPVRISVVPHRLDHVRLRKPALQDGGSPVIGVIGHIAQHKGAQVVHDLARHIAASGAQVRLVVIGTIDLELPASVATVTGPYRTEDLPALVERHGVNVGFFPSICPETFSYVTEEMMMMELPLLAFDLGAPGERVTAYSCGQVIPVGDPGSILMALESLYRTHIQSASEPSQS